VNAGKARRRRIWRRFIASLLIAIAVVPVSLVLLYRILPPPATPLMILRLVEGHGWSRDWVGWDSIDPAIMRAVIAAEDAKFCRHHGFDWEAIDDAMEANEDGRRIRGGSTISQQTAKNVFLWPGRSWLRKGLEAYLTVLIETLWSKRRILEVYLNSVEFGPGVYGVEAAARFHFKKGAADLTTRQAALLAAVLPNPIRFSASEPSGYINGYASRIQGRMGGVGKADMPPCD
jgi:monofunctional biosynthetic peptidoglycan transglycosylase